MQIVFFGSDDFAAEHLKAIIASSHKVLACVTPPDRAKGRGMKLNMSPIKELALQHHIPVLQPEKVKDPVFFEELKKYPANLYVVIAYGQILPAAMLDIPTEGAINVHPSLLPKYRGAAPINWAVINGDKQTGLTIFRLDTGMDSGAMLFQKVISIHPDDTAITLRKHMMDISPEFLIKSLTQMRNGEFHDIIQKQEEVTLAPKLTKSLGLIDWYQSAAKIHDLVQGLVPWPSAYTHYEGKLLKVLATIVEDDFIHDEEPGSVIGIDKDGIHVAAGRGKLLLQEVLLESSHRMDSASFERGHHLKVGYRFE